MANKRTCENCKYWLRSWSTWKGECHLMFIDDPPIWTSMYDAIHTASDFGCIRWEKRKKDRADA